jgi:phytoene dehydrogenase-like protein
MTAAGSSRRIRAVVVGAGANGLICAGILARAGVEVTVVEQAPQPGGGVSSAGGPLPGFTHDICSAFFPLTRVSPAFRDAGLGDIDWIAPETVMAHPFADGSAIALERGIDATAASLEATAPGAGQAWARFAEPLVREHRTLADALLGPQPPVRAGLRALASLRLDALRLVRRALMPAGTLGQKLFGDPRCAAWLSGSTAHADLDPGAHAGAALAVGLQLMGHVAGWPFPRGGSRALTAALVTELESHGGQIRTGIAVEEILVSGRRTTGVRLARGERLDSDVVVATVSARPFAALLPAGALPRGVARRLAGWRHDLGTFKVDFALRGAVPWTASECRRAGVVHVGDTLDALVRSFAAARAGRFPAEPALVVGQQSLFDNARAPTGSETLYSYARSPLRLDVGDDEAADRVEAAIERFAPGFRELVVARTVRGPDAIEAHDPSMVGGDLGGGSYRLDQQLLLRPHPRLWRTRTPIRGLYLAGASVHPGGGVHGSQGMNAARAALAALDGG